jgi:hypothetical protein
MQAQSLFTVLVHDTLLNLLSVDGDEIGGDSRGTEPATL